MTSPALLRLRRIHHHHRRRRKVLLPWSGTPSSWMVPSNHFSARAPPTATHALDAPRRHPRRLAAGTRPAHPAATAAAADDERPPPLGTSARPVFAGVCVSGPTALLPRRRLKAPPGDILSPLGGMRRVGEAWQKVKSHEWHASAGVGEEAPDARRPGPGSPSHPHVSSYVSLGGGGRGVQAAVGAP